MSDIIRRFANPVALLLLALGLFPRPLLAMASPATPRVPEAHLADAAEYSRRTGGQALLVVQGGRTLHESAAPGDAGRAFWVMSLTKTLAALAVLAARADGLLDLDEPAAKTLSEWRDHPRKSRITIRQLLNQTSGLAPGYPAIYARGTRAKGGKNKIALAQAALAEPGATFDYGPANSEVLEEILRRKLAPRGVEPLAYLRARVLTPLGVTPADWRRDARGQPFFSAGAKLTARDVAKVAEFLRSQGRVWIVPVLPAAAIRGAFTGSAANPAYGFSFWLNANARRPGATPLSIEDTLGDPRSPAQWRLAALSNAAPADLVAMVGSGGQRCYVVPSRRLVVVRFGRGANFSDAEFLRRLFGPG